MPQTGLPQPPVWLCWTGHRLLAVVQEKVTRVSSLRMEILKLFNPPMFSMSFAFTLSCPSDCLKSPGHPLQRINLWSSGSEGREKSNVQSVLFSAPAILLPSGCLEPPVPPACQGPAAAIGFLLLSPPAGTLILTLSTLLVTYCLFVAFYILCFHILSSGFLFFVSVGLYFF